MSNNDEFTDKDGSAPSQLISLVSRTQELLQEILKEPSPYFEESALELAREARVVLVEELADDFEQVIDILRNVDLGEALSSLPEEALKGLEPEQKRLLELMGIGADNLEAHGLTGRQLDFKLNAIDWAHQKFRSSGGAKWLRKLLEMIDIVFKSMADANLGTGAISEFKDMLEKLLDETPPDEESVEREDDDEED